MARGDRRLERVEPRRRAELLRAGEAVEPARDELRVPGGPVLIEEQDGVARGVDARGGARLLQLHERDEAVRLGLARRQLDEHPPEPQRVLAEPRPHDVVARGGGIALVEDEVDDAEDGRQPRGQAIPPRDLEGDTSLGQGPLGAHDPLRDRGLGHEESAGDLLGRQAAEQAQREGDPALEGQDRVARDQDEPQHVVAHVVVDLGRDVRNDPLPLGLEGRELLVLSGDDRAVPHGVDRAVARRGLQPGARAVRMPACGHCSSAATRASCASSSATPTSRTIRTSPATTRADSRRKTSRMAACVVALTHASRARRAAAANRTGESQGTHVPERRAVAVASLTRIEWRYGRPPPPPPGGS